jgi:hypothetical protein
VLGLLLVEVPGESDDVGVDLLVTSGTALTVCRHVCVFVGCERVLEGLQWVFVSKEGLVVVVEVAVYEENARSMLSIFLGRCWQRLRGDLLCRDDITKVE